MSTPEALVDLAGLGITPDGLDIPRTRRIYVHRNTRMQDVHLVGFDMDYTIAIYKQAEMEKLSIQLTLSKMVEKRGYPEAILGLDYSPEWGIRGLVVDQPHGNIFKMDRHGHVGRAFHGRRPLTKEERQALYRKERIRLSTPRYAWIDTLFALPEAVMYSALVEYLDPRGPVDYQKLWRDVRECIDEAHRDDSLKSVIKADLGRFLSFDPALAGTLHKLRSAGKKLFMLTNSLWDYTDAVMRHLLDGQMAAYASWRSYFDIVIVGGAKPGFFTEKRVFEELDEKGQTISQIVPGKGGLHRGHIYQGGNLGDFEAMAGFAGENVLYIGDHIYGDILRAKKSSVWRTAMIVQELEDEITLSEAHRARLTELDELDRKRRNLDAEVDYQQHVLKTLQRLAEDGASSPAVESGKKAAKQSLDRLRANLREVSERYDMIEAECDLSYNPHWGPLFKEGNENSRFGEQVEDYACLYTSRVSNFGQYSPLRYFRAPRDKMPHEV
jgi:HAD superfamily 5'-nucleotidase-like hydrolase